MTDPARQQLTGEELPERGEGSPPDPVEQVLQATDEFLRRWAGLLPDYWHEYGRGEIAVYCHCRIRELKGGSLRRYFLVRVMRATTDHDMSAPECDVRDADRARCGGELQRPMFVRVRELADENEGRKVRGALWLQSVDTPFDLGKLGKAPIQPTDDWVCKRVLDWELRGWRLGTVYWRSSARYYKTASKMVEAVSKVLEQITNHKGEVNPRPLSAQIKMMARKVRVEIGRYEVRLTLFVPKNLILDELQVMVGPPDLSFNPVRKRNHGSIPIRSAGQ
jgi:hypothetical protein